VVRFIGRLLLLCLFVLMVALPAWAGPAGAEQGLQKAAACLLGQEGAGADLSAWSYVALAGAGKSGEAARVHRACEAGLAGLRQGDTNRYSALVFAVLAAGADPRAYCSRDLVREIQEAQLPGGKFADNVITGGENLVNAHIWAVLALTAAGAAIPDPEGARRWLISRQLANGGFNWNAAEKTAADVDTTGMALMALAAIGEDKESPAVKRALTFLRRVQLSNGGFTSWGTENPESCSAVIQGLVALGIDPRGAEWQKSGGDPVTALLSFQLPSGAFAHQKGGEANEMATYQALMALADLHYGSPLFGRLRTQQTGGRLVLFRVGERRYMVMAAGSYAVKEADGVPFIAAGRTYVPVRHLAAALGVPTAGIRWSAATRTVTLKKGGTTVVLVPGKRVITINGRTRKIDAATVLKGGRTYIPARYVAQAFGYDVAWDALTKSVTVSG